MKITIPLKLPGANEYINACRTNKYVGAKMKRDIETDIAWFIKKLPVFDRVSIHFHWVEGNEKRDYDNISFAKKFILDTMVKCGKLKDDNRKNVYAFTDTFETDKAGKEWKVILDIRETDDNIVSVETSIYDKETIYENCTVQIWENTVTGECSIGWWKNE